MNLPAGTDVPEIQIFHIRLRGDRLDDRVLAHIDMAVPQLIWFELERSTPDRIEVQAAAAYKRRSEADAGALVIHEVWRSPWAAADTPRAPLPPAISLDALYAGMLRALWPYPARPGETLRAHAERLSRAAAAARTVKRLETQVRRTSDFARQIETNHELRAARESYRELTNPT